MLPRSTYTVRQRDRQGKNWGFEKILQTEKTTSHNSWKPAAIQSAHTASPIPHRVTIGKKSERRVPTDRSIASSAQHSPPGRGVIHGESRGTILRSRGLLKRRGKVHSCSTFSLFFTIYTILLLSSSNRPAIVKINNALGEKVCDLLTIRRPPFFGVSKR